MYPAREDLILLYHECAPGHTYLGILDRASKRIVTAFGGTATEAASHAADYLGLAPHELIRFLVVRHDGSPLAEEAEEIVMRHRAQGWDFLKSEEEYYKDQTALIQRRGW